MRFDPKLIHPDLAPLSEDGEIALPDELAALGDRLHSDAVNLAARYPCDESASGLRSPTSAGQRASCGQQEGVGSLWRKATLAAINDDFRQRRPIPSARTAVAFRAAIAVSLAALLVAVIAIWLTAKPATTLATSESAPQQATAAVPTVSVPAAVSPAAKATLSLGDLSSPELEAVLDLWQNEPGRAASVSF